MAATVFVGSAGDLIASVDGGEDSRRQVGGWDGVGAVKHGCFAPLVLIVPGCWAEGATAQEAGEEEKEEAVSLVHGSGGRKVVRAVYWRRSCSTMTNEHDANGTDFGAP